MSCFPRGLISLNTSVSYLIEPLPAAGDAQQHALFRAESLHLPGGSCLHHHGNKEHEEGLNDFITGMMSPQNGRVRTDSDHLPKFSAGFSQSNSVTSCSVLNCCSFSGKKGPEPEFKVCGAAVSG